MNKHHLRRTNVNPSSFQKMQSMVTLKFSTFYHVVWQSLRMKRQNLKYH